MVKFFVTRTEAGRGEVAAVKHTPLITGGRNRHQKLVGILVISFPPGENAADVDIKNTHSKYLGTSEI